MPTRTDPSASPGVRTHSCSAVYFRSSGYTALLVVAAWIASVTDRATTDRATCPSAGYPWSLGLGVLRRGRLPHRGDVEGVELVDVHRGVGVLELRDGPVHELERPAEGMWVAD